MKPQKELFACTVILICAMFFSCGEKNADIPDGHPIITSQSQSKVYIIDEEVPEQPFVEASVINGYTLSYQWYTRSYDNDTNRERIEQEAAIEIDKVINNNLEDMLFGKRDDKANTSWDFDLRSSDPATHVFFCIVTSTSLDGRKTFMVASDPVVITILQHPLRAWYALDKHQFAFIIYIPQKLDNHVYFSDVAYGNGRFVAVGNRAMVTPDVLHTFRNCGVIAYSNDGETWHIVNDSTFGYGNGISAVAYGNGRFVAVGYNRRIAYSSDGETWTSVEYSVPNSFYGIVYGNDRFIAYSSSTIACSSNGETWFAIEHGDFFDTSGISHMAYGNGRFIAGSGDGKIAYSNDGETWNTIKDDPFDSHPIVTIAHGNNRFLAFASRYNGDYSDWYEEVKMAYSDDGETWHNVKPHYKFYDYWNWISAITYGNGYFVAVGGDKVAYSRDGVSWYNLGKSNLLNAPQYRVYYKAIAYGDGFFVTVGDDAVIEVCQWPLKEIKTPVVTSHPVTANYNPGNPAKTLYVGIDINKIGYGVCFYQWYRNDTDSTATGTPIEGANNWNYTPDTTKAGTTYYYVTITNTIHDIFNVENKTASVTSNTATIIVNQPEQTNIEVIEVFDK